MRLAKLGVLSVCVLHVFSNPIEWDQTSFSSSTDYIDEDIGHVDGSGIDTDDFNRLRKLTLGQINFLHTTDTHGWLGSHPNQKDYDANWGDFVSFVELFKQKRIDKKKQDLIIVDTGDKHDGSGYSDATVPNGIESTKIFNELDYDLLTLGNHELYDGERTALEYYSTVLSPKFKDKYVASNVDFITDDGTLVPYGNKFIYMETPANHLRVLCLSFIFNYQINNPRAKVTPCIDSVKLPWFQQVVKDYPEDSIDMLVVFGHIPARDEENHELKDLHEYLRQIYPNIVIQYFGGHSHIRDFVELDPKATCLQSGRFSETVGFLSINNVTDDEPGISRSYIDFNKRSFKFHTHSLDLLTKRGLKVTHRLNQLRETLQLNERFGTTPQTYYMMARPIDSEENIYYLLKNEVLPRLTSDLIPSDELSMNRIIMLNTGAVRYDLFKGSFTRDTEYSVLPFANDWKYMKLEKWVAIQIEKFLNAEPVITMLAPPEQKSVQNMMIMSQSDHLKVQECPFIKKPRLTEGYTTGDDYGCDGDDTPHNSQNIFPLPNVIQSSTLSTEYGMGHENELIDFIFFSFLKDDILKALKHIDPSRAYTDDDVKGYGGKSAKQLLREYIIEISR